VRAGKSPAAKGIALPDSDCTGLTEPHYDGDLERLKLLLATLVYMGHEAETVAAAETAALIAAAADAARRDLARRPAQHGGWQ
jgi:hypothetical protein